MKSQAERVQRVEIEAMALSARRGKRRFEILGNRRTENGYRRITIIESGHSDIYDVPLSDFPKFYSGMIPRLLDRHVRGLLRNKPRKLED